MDLPQFVILIQIKKKQCSSQLDLLDFFLALILKYLIFRHKDCLFEKIRLKPFFWLNSVCVSSMICKCVDQF